MSKVVTKLPKVGTTIFTVMSQLAAEHGAVNLGQGFPDFAVPAAAGRGTRQGHARRPQPVRDDDRRPGAAPGDRRQDRSAVWRIAPMPTREITVTSGATEAIFNAIHAVVRPGEEVIVLDPCYDCYEPAIDLAGARAVHVPLDPHTFAPDWQRVRDAITPSTRMLMINSPHNPSGAMLSADGHARGGRPAARHRHLAALRRGLRAHRVRRRAPRIGAALSGAARTRVRDLELRQDLPLHRLEDRLLHRAAGDERGIPQGAPVQRVLHLRPGAARLRRDAGGRAGALRTARARSTRPSATVSASSC